MVINYTNPIDEKWIRKKNISQAELATKWGHLMRFQMQEQDSTYQILKTRVSWEKGYQWHAHTLWKNILIAVRLHTNFIWQRFWSDLIRSKIRSLCIYLCITCKIFFFNMWWWSVITMQLRSICSTNIVNWMLISCKHNCHDTI